MVQLSGSKLVDALIEEEGEEEEGGEEVVLVGGNLAKAEPILISSSDDKTSEVLAVPKILEVFREKVEIFLLDKERRLI